VAQRLTSLTPGQLTDDQRAVYEGITGGDRLKGTQHFPVVAEDGSLNGPFGVMVHVPGVGGALQELGAAIRYRTSLTARVREIAILLVASKLHSDFEWWAHERVARAVGLTDDELEQLSKGQWAAPDPVEQAAADLSVALLDNAAVSDGDYARYGEVLGVQAIVELTSLVGYYRTLAQLMAVFDIGIPGDA
jgi:4-carboxymuconolactone decarboxylase